MDLVDRVAVDLVEQVEVYRPGGGDRIDLTERAGVVRGDRTERSVDRNQLSRGEGRQQANGPCSRVVGRVDLLADAPQFDGHGAGPTNGCQNGGGHRSREG